MCYDRQGNFMGCPAPEFCTSEPPQEEELHCLQENNDCLGAVEYRMPLSGTGKAFPRCEKHWDDRLQKQSEHHAWEAKARNVDYLDAGERWDDEY